MDLTHQEEEPKHVHQFQMILKKNLVGLILYLEINQINDWVINYGQLIVRSIKNAT
jgi:hypothetical protein